MVNKLQNIVQTSENRNTDIESNNATKNINKTKSALESQINRLQTKLDNKTITSKELVRLNQAKLQLKKINNQIKNESARTTKQTKAKSFNENYIYNEEVERDVTSLQKRKSQITSQIRSLENKTNLTQNEQARLNNLKEKLNEINKRISSIKSQGKLKFISNTMQSERENISKLRSEERTARRRNKQT